MSRLQRLVRALPLAVALAPAFAADDPAGAGRKIFESRCVSCHENAPPSTATLGPSLAGIVGRKAGTGTTGVHSRALAESGIVWNRSSLRSYLSDPGRAVPGTIMPLRVENTKELEDLLNYLETLR
ncbi:MAG TPA: c-type cytochrome [Burkholderiales bacterium]|nr:c-type cytochrome [Burkholderiales bacterium]